MVIYDYLSNDSEGFLIIVPEQKIEASILRWHKTEGDSVKVGELLVELTPEQKAENQHLARQRVYVEHGVRRVKAWRIMGDEFRLGIGLFPLVATATVGLVHLARLCWLEGKGGRRFCRQAH